MSPGIRISVSQEIKERESGGIFSKENERQHVCEVDRERENTWMTEKVMMME